MNQEKKVLLGIGLGTLILIFVGVFFLSNSSTPTSQPGTPVDQNLLNSDSANKITYPDAQITITEFADYECPACASYNNGIKQTIKDFEGKVNFVYRHFPLPQHKNARPAINAAEAAGEQGKFWEMSDLLYARQSSWARVDNPEEVFINLAKELQLDEEKFKNDMTANKYDDKIQKDLSDAKSLGVNGTPTIYINNQKFNLAPTAVNLKAEIDKLVTN